MKLLQYDPNQTTITFFFSISDEISKLIKENQHLVKIIHSLREQKHENPNVTAILSELMSNACHNINKVPNNRRFDEVMVKFSTSLLIYAGPLAYRFFAAEYDTCSTIVAYYTEESKQRICAYI